MQDPSRQRREGNLHRRHARASSPRRRWSGCSKCDFTKLAVTDTIPIGTRADAIKDRLVVLSVAELLGEAIHRIHHNASVSALFKTKNEAEQ